MNTLAIDIGGTKFVVAVFEGEKLVRRETYPTDRSGGRDWMLEQLASVSRPLKRGYRLDRCGVSFGGQVDFARQRVRRSTHVNGWENFPLGEFLSGILEVEVIIDNDANAGAIGEAKYGAGRGHAPLLYVTLSTGIGGGIWGGECVWHGADGSAGEIGHITVRPDGPECLCKARGCLERLCSGLWLERDFGKSAKELFRDPEFVARYVVDLALGLKAAVMLLNPARIVIGGGISNAGNALFRPLEIELRRQFTDWSGARVDVVPAELGDDSPLYGALMLAKKI